MKRKYCIIHSPESCEFQGHLKMPRREQYCCPPPFPLNTFYLALSLIHGACVCFIIIIFYVVMTLNVFFLLSIEAIYRQTLYVPKLIPFKVLYRDRSAFWRVVLVVELRVFHMPDKPSLSYTLSRL